MVVEVGDMGNLYQNVVLFGVMGTKDGIVGTEEKLLINWGFGVIGWWDWFLIMGVIGLDCVIVI